MIGAQTYSFRTLPSLDDCIAAMKEIGLGYAELWDNQIVPKDRSQIAAWRTNPPMDEIRGIRKKFDDAGIDLYAFNYSFRDEFTDRADRTRLSHGEGHGRYAHHRFGERGHFAARRQVRRAVQDLCRLSRSRQHEAERVFDSGRLETGAGRPIEIHRHQSRHRALHRRRLRSGEFPRRASRARSSRCTSRIARRITARTCRSARATPTSKACSKF